MSSSRDLPALSSRWTSPARHVSINIHFYIWSAQLTFPGRPSVMAEIEASAGPQRSAQLSPDSTVSDLHDRLDALWISYLRYLDVYTTAQKALQQHLRSGFFSLSRANFNARPGMRYGRDYFHERAVASATVTVTREDAGDSDNITMTVRRHPQPIYAQKDTIPVEKQTATVEGRQQQQPPSPPARPSPRDHTTNGSLDDDNAVSAETNENVDEPEPNSSESKLPLEADPVRWFGILVPQELRSARASFSEAMDDGVPKAVNAGRAMREIEAEIRRLRKEIRRAERAARG